MCHLLKILSTLCECKESDQLRGDILAAVMLYDWALKAGQFCSHNAQSLFMHGSVNESFSAVLELFLFILYQCCFLTRRMNVTVTVWLTEADDANVSLTHI